MIKRRVLRICFAYWIFAAVVFIAAGPAVVSAESNKVNLLRVPQQGLQPQVAVDGQGNVHMIYFKGDARSGDVFYVHSNVGSSTFSRPLRANSQPGSAIAAGNIRGAHLALGKNGRVHVAWMGSSQAEPKAPEGKSPMLYTRLDDAGTDFEPQRNIIQLAVGLDGGGSVAADQAGNVYVAWHAPAPGTQGEENRTVWVARSSDEGRTFTEETAAFDQATGACGCCGMRAFADRRGTLYMLYRSATDVVNRDMYLLKSDDHGQHFQGTKLQEWKIDTCPMSSAALAESPQSVLAAWETDSQVYFARVDLMIGGRARPVGAPGFGVRRKHPAVAGNSAGETILVWTEGMGWNRGGSVVWQVFDKHGEPTLEKGRADGVPTWSLVSTFARPDGSFTVVY